MAIGKPILKPTNKVLRRPRFESVKQEYLRRSGGPTGMSAPAGAPAQPQRTESQNLPRHRLGSAASERGEISGCCLSAVMRPSAGGAGLPPIPLRTSATEQRPRAVNVASRREFSIRIMPTDAAAAASAGSSAPVWQPELALSPSYSWSSEPVTQPS